MLWAASKLSRGHCSRMAVSQLHHSVATKWITHAQAAPPKTQSYQIWLTFDILQYAFSVYRMWGYKKVSKSWGYFWEIRYFHCKSQSHCLFSLPYMSSSSFKLSIVLMKLWLKIKQGSTDKKCVSLNIFRLLFLSLSNYVNPFFAYRVHYMQNT